MHDQHPRGAQPPIFRAEALRRYQGQQLPEAAPTLARGPAGRVWLVFALLLVCTGLVWLAPIPQYVSGPAAPISGRADAQYAVALPADRPAQVRPGQPVLLRLADVSLRGSVAAVLSPAEQRRAGLAAYPFDAAAPQPDIALVQLEQPHLGQSGTAPERTQPRADVQVDTRRLIDWLPLVGPRGAGAPAPTTQTSMTEADAR